MLPVTIEPDGYGLRVGERFHLRLERTLRVPDDGRKYPLPPGLGHFRVHKVAEYAEQLPARWHRDDFFITLHQAEALWLSLEVAEWKPNAVTIGVGRVNAISGGEWPGTLRSAPQNYLVCPPQLWLDGINAGRGFVRQFVALPLGRGYTVEGQLTGVERHGGLQVRVYEPKPGRFPDVAPLESAPPPAMAQSAMGFVPGGQIDQKILEDPYGVGTWDTECFGSLSLHVLNSEQYRAVTGNDPPQPPIDARTYTEHGFPWFRIYEEQADVAPPDRLAVLKSLGQMADALPTGDSQNVLEVSPSQIRDIHRRSRGVPDKGE